MAQRLYDNLNDFLKHDPLCQQLGPPSKVKKLKTMQKEAEERRRFVEKYSGTSRLSTLTPLLNEKIATLKTHAERFESAYGEFGGELARLGERKEALSKRKMDLANVEKLRETFNTQIHALQERLKQVELDMSKEALAYTESKQKELEAEYGRQKETVHERQSTIKQNEVLREKMGSILTEIQTQSEAMDKDYEEKRGEVANSKLKSLSGFDKYKKELGCREDLEKEIADCEAFCRRVQPDLEEVEGNVQEYENLFNNSIKDFERPLKKVDRIKKDNAALRKTTDDVQEQLRKNNKGLADLIEENSTLRGRIGREEKQQAILQKMVEDFEAKLRQG